MSPPAKQSRNVLNFARQYLVLLSNVIRCVPKKITSLDYLT